MKIYIILPFVMLAGLLFGAFGTRTDLKRTERELKQAKEELKQVKRGPRDYSIPVVSGLLKMENSKKAADTKKTAKDAPAKKNAAGETKTGEETPEKPHRKDRRPDKKARPDNPADNKSREEQMESEIDKAIALWEVRSRIARKTFVANAGLDQEQAAVFDTLVDAMNIRIESTIDKWVEENEERETLGPEEGIKLANGVTEAIVNAYDDMDRKMPENWRDSAGHMNMTDFIDPAVGRPLVKLGDKMDGLGRNPDAGGGGK